MVVWACTDSDESVIIREYDEMLKARFIVEVDEDKEIIR